MGTDSLAGYTLLSHVEFGILLRGLVVILLLLLATELVFLLKDWLVKRCVVAGLIKSPIDGLFSRRFSIRFLAVLGLDHLLLHNRLQSVYNFQILLQRILVHIADFLLLFLDVTHFLMKFFLKSLHLIQIFSCHKLVFLKLKRLKWSEYIG